MILTIIIASVITALIAQKNILLPVFRTGCEIDTVSAIAELTYKIYIRESAVN